jgi:hypothetical protein
LKDAIKLGGRNPTDFNEFHYDFLGNLQYFFFISRHRRSTSSHKKASAGWKKACFLYTAEASEAKENRVQHSNPPVLYTREQA